MTQIRNQKPKVRNAKSEIRTRHRRGVSLIELLLALAITAMLLTATMVAIDVCFRSYATAAEMASAQAVTRIVTHRLLTLIRTSTAHGPLVPDGSTTPPVTLNGQTIESHYIELLDRDDNLVRVEYDANAQELWLTITPNAGAGTPQTHPLIGGVTNCQFYAQRRQDDNGFWVLNRGTMDLTVEPGRDATLGIENGNNTPIRMIASTMPRKLD